MDEAQLKQTGIWLVIVLGALGTVFLELISKLQITDIWILFLGISWYVIEYIIAVVIYHFFKVKKNNTKWPIKSLMIGIGIGIIIEITSFGTVLLEWITNFDLSLTWIAFIGVMYYSTESLLVGLIIHYFKVPIEEIPSDVTLTPLEDIGKAQSGEPQSYMVHDDQGNITEYFVESDKTAPEEDPTPEPEPETE